jgi:hypothetical protein
MAAGSGPSSTTRARDKRTRAGRSLEFSGGASPPSLLPPGTLRTPGREPAGGAIMAWIDRLWGSSPSALRRVAYVRAGSRKHGHRPHDMAPLLYHRIDKWSIKIVLIFTGSLAGLCWDRGRKPREAGPPALPGLQLRWGFSRSPTPWKPDGLTLSLVVSRRRN